MEAAVKQYTPRAAHGGRLLTPGATLKQFFFDGSTNDAWATALANLTAAADTTNWIAAGNLNGSALRTQGLRLTPTGNTFGNVSQDVSPAVDLSNACGVLRFYLRPEDTAAAGVSGMIIRLRDTSNVTVTVNVWSLNQRLSKGWTEVAFCVPSLFTGLNLAAINRITVTPGWNTGYAGWVTLDWLKFFTRPSKARLLLRLDDGFDGHLAHAAAADALGIPVHFLCIGSYTQNGEAGYLTPDQFRRIRDMSVRHPILNHAWDIKGVSYASDTGKPGWRWGNSGNTVATSLDIRRSEIGKTADYMESLGLGEFSRVFVVPGGWDQPDDKTLVDEGTAEWIWYLGSGDPTALPTSAPRAWPPHQARWRGGGTYTLDGQSIAQVEAAVDTLVAAKGLGIFAGHELTDDVWQAMLVKVAAAVSAGTLEVITVRDLLR